MYKTINCPKTNTGKETKEKTKQILQSYMLLFNKAHENDPEARRANYQRTNVAMTFLM